MIKVISFTSLFLILLTSCNQKLKEDQVEKWIADNSVLIGTVEAGNGFKDLLPIGEMVGDARIVSLGEPTHGNREVFQLKHRLIEYLVTEKGFNIFALECPFAEAFDVNKYIIEGIGTPEEALAGIYYWAWDTKEVVELLKWMRTYNADPSHITKLRFYGFDTQDPERAARFMLEYLQIVDPLLSQEVLPELNILQIPFSEPKAMGRRPFIPEEYDEAGFFEIKRVMKAFEDRKDDYILKTSNLEYNVARQHARQVEMWIEDNRGEGKKFVDVREKGQAENIQWILDQEGDSSKVIVWAHNSHVANAAPKDYDVMGKYLKESFENQLKIFGIFFNQGEFWALDVDLPSKGMDSFLVGPAPQGTLEYTLASSGLSLSALDMDQIPSEGPVHDWFYTKHPTRHSGSGYNIKTPENYFWSYIPAEAFDVLVFLDRTTPVEVVNKSDFEEIWMLDKKLDRPMNLDFEVGTTGDHPKDWLVWSKFQRLGVVFEVTDASPYQGKNSVLLHRPDGVRFGELTPNLTQTIDATPYRGKKIRIKAATRSEVEKPGFAFFRLVIEPDVLQSAHDGANPLFDNLDESRITSSEWEIFMIEAEVPEEANTITYGIYLRDFGSVWLDDLEIEIIE